ncbi:MAG: hypothetical protein JSU63_21475 [Phycisphaerales bacterium]|nr:MAG: hypothetical protein JSU63_21475 [Phycisphaerales bacterium]
MECRLSQHKRPPFGVVTVGTTPWLKQSGRPIRATATVAQVDYTDPLTTARLSFLRLRCGESVQAGPDSIDARRQSQFTTFIRPGNVRRIDPFLL